MSNIEEGSFVRHPEYGVGRVVEADMVVVENSDMQVYFEFCRVKVGSKHIVRPYGEMTVTALDGCRVQFELDEMRVRGSELEVIPMDVIINIVNHSAE